MSYPHLQLLVLVACLCLIMLLGCDIPFSYSEEELAEFKRLRIEANQAKCAVVCPDGLLDYYYEGGGFQSSILVCTCSDRTVMKTRPPGRMYEQ